MHVHYDRARTRTVAHLHGTTPFEQLIRFVDNPYLDVNTGDPRVTTSIRYPSPQRSPHHQIRSLDVEPLSHHQLEANTVELLRVLAKLGRHPICAWECCHRREYNGVHRTVCMPEYFSLKRCMHRRCKDCNEWKGDEGYGPSSRRSKEL